MVDTVDWKPASKAGRRIQAVHEAGHAVVAIACGLSINLIKIDINPEDSDWSPDAAGFCEYHYQEPFPFLQSIGGLLACSLYCQGLEEMDEWNTWENCSDDLEAFNKSRKGMTYRHARKIVLGILRHRKNEVLELADVLERDGVLNYSNAPSYMKKT